MITPTATLRWHRDVEDNSVAIATFDSSAGQLLIESEVVIRQYNEKPLDFLVEDYAIDYPFAYTPEDRVLLAPYMAFSEPHMVFAPNKTTRLLTDWIAKLWQPGERIQTFALLQRLNLRIKETLSYQVREEPGVQSAKDLHTPPSNVDFGATHAWAEVYLPGMGWKGFDPTVGGIVGTDHVAVAVARLPESIPPVAGAYVGPPGSNPRCGCVGIRAVDSARLEEQIALIQS